MSLEPLDADIRILVTIDEIDHSTADEFEAQLRDGLASRGDPPVGLFIIDLRDVRFLCSAGIRVLIDAERETSARGRRLVVDGARGGVLRCLEVTGLVDHLQVNRIAGPA